ncbi:hypothetical protein BC826DRAFT_82245 [Russula brevipes]|nr:hypothetical protein BC826DRAFT_82245 [Russula brevipes]
MFLRHLLRALATPTTFHTLVFASEISHLVHRGRIDADAPFQSVLSLQVDNTTCISPDPVANVTDRLNLALNSAGPGFVLRLCPNAQYMILAPIRFAAPNQEISTMGYPTDDSRATLVVSGPVADGGGHTVAVDGNCNNCSGVILRNVQVNGNRIGAPPINTGSANIFMGGPNMNQLIEYVRSYDPRSWTCLHIYEGPDLLCNNVVIQNNEFGPCGSPRNKEVADGVTISCRSTVVRNNMINNPTQAGISLIGCPGTLVENNTIWVVNNTSISGINLVNVGPWGGNYTGTVVQNNTIIGGFATDSKSASQTYGQNANNLVMKIGIAIGPEVWDGDSAGTKVVTSGSVLNNRFTGAFGYAIAIASAQNFTVQGNTLFENTSFITSRGPDCTTNITPRSASFIVDYSNVTNSTLQSDFQAVQDCKLLTCVVPPNGGNYWPYGSHPSSGNDKHTSPSAHGSKSPGLKIGLPVGITIAVLAAVILVRRYRRSRIRETPLKTK